MLTRHSNSSCKFSFQVIWKLFLNCWDNLILVGPQRCEKLDQKKEKFDSTDDWKSSEKSHGTANETQLPFKLDLRVPFDHVKRRRVKVDLDKVETGRALIFTWKSTFYLKSTKRWENCSMLIYCSVLSLFLDWNGNWEVFSFWSLCTAARVRRLFPCLLFSLLPQAMSAGHQHRFPRK